MLIIVIFVCVSCNTPTANYEKGLKMREEYIKFLNDKYKDYKEVPYGLDITKKTDLVGICYTTWFTALYHGRECSCTVKKQATENNR